MVSVMPKTLVPTSFKMEEDLRLAYEELKLAAKRKGIPFPTLAEFLNDAARQKLAEMQKQIAATKTRK